MDEGCGLHKILHVVPQLFLKRCSRGPLLPSCFSELEGSYTTVYLGVELDKLLTVGGKELPQKSTPAYFGDRQLTIGRKELPQ